MSAKALVGTRCARPPSLTVLALAEETRAAARDAIARAQDAVLNMMEIRLAWARVRQRGNDPSPTYHNIHLGSCRKSEALPSLESVDAKALSHCHQIRAGLAKHLARRLGPPHQAIQ